VAFLAHTVDLDADLDGLFGRFDPAMRRGIRKAEKSGVAVEFRRDEEAMGEFYRLHAGTRKRHGAPPQPLSFFRHLLREVVAPGRGWVVVARHGGKAVAASVFLHFGRHVFYKYGASAQSDQLLRGNNLVMWSAIRWYAGAGFSKLSMGRTSLGNAGLARFKRNFGAHEETVHYWRHDFRKGSFVSGTDLAEGRANRLLRLMPVPILRMVGQLLYRHLS
jgi:lipid II:glycine glycyltransferase (peptidoglycan interpeptide bridge formation enzyme)